MDTLVQHLARYAAYHRDARNVATHMAGIPLIVLAVAILASRPAAAFGPHLAITPAMPLAVLAALFYLRLDLRFGIAMALMLAAACAVGLWVAGMGTPAWAMLGLGGFALGWVLQLVGHRWEGRRPAFVDDVTGLIVGPLFVAAEIAFALGLRGEVREAVHRAADPGTGTLNGGRR